MTALRVRRFQNNRRKLLAVIVFLALIPIFGALSSLSIQRSSAFSQSTSGFNDYSQTSESQSYCGVMLQKQIESISSGINESHAIALAESSYKFQTIVSGRFSYVESSIYYTWSFDPSTCEIISLDSVNAVFSIFDSGSFVNYIVITENPTISNVTDVTTQMPSYHRNSPNNNPAWSGYEFYGSATRKSVPLLEDYSTWYVPTASQNYRTDCESPICYLSVWVGLTHDIGGNTGGCNGGCIVQGGIDASLDCSSGSCGSPVYTAWYEFLPNPTVSCAPSMPISAGQEVETWVTNQAEQGGSSNLYQVYLYDYSTGKSCSTAWTNSPMGVSYFGQFIAERPPCSSGPPCGYYQLPQFTKVTMSGSYVYYNGLFNSIFTPYVNGWYQYDRIYGTCNGNNVENIGVSVPSGSSFSQTWESSCYWN